ncbi:MAG TPA: AraC family transcriptional regulator [Pyrinomonadaceae bacterium]|nr:AraC family transcriptional regulator [Pyrinomonadaceae bacterium]
MNHVSTYIRTPLVTVSRFEHPGGEAHVDPQEEAASEYSVNFVERGSYFLQVGRRRWEMSATLVFVTRPGAVFRCRHRDETPTDVSFSVCYDAAFVRDVWRHGGAGRAASPLNVAPLTNRLAYLQMRLRRAADSREEVLAAETLAGELLLALSQGGPGKVNRPYQARLFAWYAERVEAARALMDSQYASPHSLSSLARFTGMSPFHFSRVFRELTGTPPHRYLLGVRMARAAERLRDGAGVTETCFAAGFTNLSHFTRLFRRTFGAPPSRFPGKGTARGE